MSWLQNLFKNYESIDKIALDELTVIQKRMSEMSGHMGEISNALFLIIRDREVNEAVPSKTYLKLRENLIQRLEGLHRDLSDALKTEEVILKQEKKEYKRNKKESTIPTYAHTIHLLDYAKKNDEFEISIGSGPVTNSNIHFPHLYKSQVTMRFKYYNNMFYPQGLLTGEAGYVYLEGSDKPYRKNGVYSMDKFKIPFKLLLIGKNNHRVLITIDK